MEVHYIVLITGICTLLSTLFLGFIFYQPLLHFAVNHEKALKDGNEMRTFYLKLPVPLDFRVYFFNITNPDEVIEGGKTPVLEQVGPYCYDAFKEKTVIEEDEENDTLTYSPYDTYFFNQSRSGDLSPDDYVTVLHPLVVGMVNAVANMNPSLLSILEKALKAIFKESNSIYITARVREILFDGVLIDCTVKDFSATAVCSQLKGQSSIKEVEKNMFLFSLLASRNGTVATEITVKRGIDKGEDVGRVVAVNHKNNIGIWPDEKCNEFHGTDGWIFPSFLEKEDGIWSVSPDLCRSVKATFVEDLRHHGVSVRKYYADFGDVATNPEEQCFCPKDACLPKGVMDLTKCMKVPIYVTLPHFLSADEKLLEKVEGLSPDKEKHSIKILFEPITGTPIVGQRRIQFNLYLKPQPKISTMQTVPEVLHPILWIEEGIELEGFLLKKITNAMLLLKIGTGLKFVFLVGAIQCIAYGCYQVYKRRKSSEITPVEKSANSNGTVELTLGKKITTVQSQIERGKDNPVFNGD